MVAVLLNRPFEVDRRLSELGIPTDVLRRAAQAGYTARILSSPNDPPSLPGTVAWGHTVRVMREGLLATGNWRKDDPGNFSLAINDALGVNIYVSSGDAMTGRLPPFRQPHTKSPKGLYTEAAVTMNTRQGDLFGVPQDVAHKAVALGYPTWVFLVFITDEEIRAELSFPGSFEDGEVTDWRERIVIPDIELETEVIVESRDPGPDIDIPVRRRS